MIFMINVVIRNYYFNGVCWSLAPKPVYAMWVQRVECALCGLVQAGDIVTHCFASISPVCQSTPSCLSMAENLPKLPLAPG